MQKHSFIQHSLFIIGISLICTACGEKSTENTVNTPNTKQDAQVLVLRNEQVKNLHLSYDSLQNIRIYQTIRANGKIDVPPQNLISVSAPMGGYLKHTKLLPGMHIRKGEIIATLEDQAYIQLQEEYLSEKERLSFLELEYERQKELNQSKASSDKVFQQVHMEYQTTKIKLKALAEKLRLINISPERVNENNISRSIPIYAPINSYVSSVNINIGKYITPGDVLFELVNPEDIHLNLHIFEKDLDLLSIGQSLQAFTNNHPEKKHTCTIILISRNINQERYAEVHCHFSNYDPALLPGMYMNAEINVTDTNAEAVLSEAIVSYQDKDYLFITGENNRFEAVEIKKGVVNKGYTQILNPEQFRGKRIVCKGAYQLLMALKNTGVEE